MSKDAIDAGGPAFPVSCNEAGYRANVPDGMTLRDYFAAKALVGISYMVAHGQHCTQGLGVTPEEKIATDAYRLADAMLKARKS